MTVDNPYAPPAVDSSVDSGPARKRLRSVARSFQWIGSAATIVYIPIVIMCFFSLVMSLLGRNNEIPGFMVVVCLFNGSILALGMSLIWVGRKIAIGDQSVRTTALILSCILMLGFPLLTIIGVICFRHIRRHLPTIGEDAT